MRDLRRDSMRQTGDPTPQHPDASVALTEIFYSFHLSQVSTRLTSGSTPAGCIQNKMTDIPVNAMIQVPRYLRNKEVSIGGPRLIVVSRGMTMIEQPPDAVTRTRGRLFLYERPSEMGAEPWLVFGFSVDGPLAGNDLAEDISEGEPDHVLEEVGEIPIGLLWSSGKKLSMLSADMSKDFMSQAVLPHYLMLPKRVPASIRMSRYWQLWVNL